MSTLLRIFDTCKPRPDVETGTTKDEQFAANLAEVVNGTAAREYTDPKTFFGHTYPTWGLKELLKAICERVWRRTPADFFIPWNSFGQRAISCVATTPWRPTTVGTERATSRTP